MPVAPRTIRELVEADLRRAARLVIKVQDEIDPQFRIATPEGDYSVAMTLPADGAERAALLQRFGSFLLDRPGDRGTAASATAAGDAQGSCGA